MTLVWADNVEESSATAGLADFVLGGAVADTLPFSVIGGSNTCYYTAVENGTANWETGLGTYQAAGPTLQRTAVLSSSNGGAKVSFGGALLDISAILPAAVIASFAFDTQVIHLAGVETITGGKVFSADQAFTGQVGIGAGANPPRRALHLSVSFAGHPTALALENTNTTDPSGVTISCRTTTTGTGAAAFTEYAVIQGICVQHDNATLAGKLNFFTTAAGTEALRWTISETGSLLAGTDNAWDIGAAGANRPRHLYIAGNFDVGGAVLSNPAASQLGCNGAFLAADEVRAGNGSAWALRIVDGGGFPAFIISSNKLGFPNAANIQFGTTTGTQLGTAVGEKIALHGSAPVVQRSGVAQAAVATTASTQTTPFGYTTQAQADAIVTLVNEIRAALVEKGIIKGSA